VSREQKEVIFGQFDSRAIFYSIADSCLGLTSQKTKSSSINQDLSDSSTSTIETAIVNPA